MNRNCSRLAILVLGLSLLPSLARAQVVAADRFVDAAGVNVHLHYFGTAYDDFPLVRSRLIELGVRHVRDGLIDTAWEEYYQRFQSLAQAGIRATFIVAPTQSTELWAQYPARMGAAFEAFEGPNEYDLTGNTNWAETVRQTMIRTRSLRNDRRSARFPVLAPSLTSAESYTQLGDVSAYFDAANIHNYFGGRWPCTPGWGGGGYGSISWNLDQVRPFSGGKPVISTETGYLNNPTVPNAIPQDVAGRYMPRVLLEHFRAGIVRTFLYELIDLPSSDQHGLLNEDGSPKPAFTAVKNLLHLLADPGPSFTPQDLGYTVEGGSNVRHLVFQKRDGTYYLALWLGVSAYDNHTQQRVDEAPETVTVTTTSPMHVRRTHAWQPDGSLATSDTLATTATIPVTISDALTLIELTTPPPATPPPVTPPPATPPPVVPPPVTPSPVTPSPVTPPPVLPPPAELPPGPPPMMNLPGAPVGVSAAVSGRSVLLRWQPPVDGPPLAGYVIEAGARPDFIGAVTVPVGPTTQLSATNVAPGLYYLRVRAGNAIGLGVPSSTINVSVGVPAAPQLLALQVAINPVVLQWSPVAGASHYVLSAGTSPNASDVAIVHMGTATRVVAPVPAGVRYYVSVAAVNQYGAAKSNEVSFAVGVPQPPSAPTLRSASVSGRRLTLSWSPAAGVVDNYILVAGTSSGSADLGVFAVGRTTQITGDSPINGTLFVRVYAQNASGTTASNEVSFTVP